MTRVYFLAFSLAGPDATPYREIDQQCCRIKVSQHPLQGSGGRARACERMTAGALATRCPSSSAMPPGGASPSKSGPGRRRTRTFPVKRRELCRMLSYGAVVMM